MNLSKQDVRIIMNIRLEGRPMANYEIAKRMHVHPAQTFKRLTLMAQNRVLQVNDGYPKFYSLDPNNKVQSFIVLTIECPKCKKLHIRHASQTTIQCDCKTSSGNPSRFYVYNSRIKNKKIITNQSEKDVTSELHEKEQDVSDIIQHD